MNAKGKTVLRSKSSKFGLLNKAIIKQNRIKNCVVNLRERNREKKESDKNFEYCNHLSIPLRLMGLFGKVTR